MLNQGQEVVTVNVPLKQWEELTQSISKLEQEKKDFEVFRKAAIDGNELIHMCCNYSDMPFWIIYSKEKMDELMNEDYLRLREEYSKLSVQSMVFKRGIEKSQELENENKYLKFKIETLKFSTPKVIGFWEI